MKEWEQYKKQKLIYQIKPNILRDMVLIFFFFVSLTKSSIF